MSRHSELDCLIGRTTMTLEKDPTTDPAGLVLASVDEAVALPLQISVSSGADSTRVILAGELDDASVSFLHENMRPLLAGRPPGDLSVDIGLLTFIDSTGLSFLVTLHKRVQEMGRSLTVTDPTPMARRLFEITALDQVLRIEPPAAPASHHPH